MEMSEISTYIVAHRLGIALMGLISHEIRKRALGIDEVGIGKLLPVSDIQQMVPKMILHKSYS